jgi:UDP-N-acetylglucosamine--N-acetylmuramyl-(pentapeptide) pyrophosphoryl-undecaprenol N-acetylglucosamine transferase
MILQLDSHPGIANRWSGCFATRVGVALPEYARQFARSDRIHVVGNPIRAEVMSASRDDGLAAFALESDRRTILAFGGSLGSRAINQAFVDALRMLSHRPGWALGHQVLHVTGRANLITLSPVEVEEMGLLYRSMDYCDQMPLALAAADLAICRSGATTLAEITARGVPAILIPWSGAADNHQEGNARALERRGAATIILDSELSPNGLAAGIDEMLSQPYRLVEMAAASRSAGRPDAAQQVVDVLASISAERL